jgi:hypothetical protein
MAFGLLIHVGVVMLVDTWAPRPRLRQGGQYTELTAIGAGVPDSAAD